MFGSSTFVSGQNYKLSTRDDNESKDYIARDYVRLLPGYSFKAENGKTMHAAISETNTPFSVNYDRSGSIANSYSLGSVGGSLNVSPSGAATYGIPIEIPVGINGMQPQVAITYNSQSGNGIAGWGTNISGISAITRVPKSIYYDGTAKGITHNTDDAFALDGQRLILSSGTAGTNGAVYTTESDPFTTVTFKDNYFEVQSKDGMRYFYGNTNDSKQSYNDVYGVNKTNAWYLSVVADLWGNQIFYTYSTAQYRAYRYLQSISYGNNTISFSYEDRPDKTLFKLETVNGLIDKRIKSITSKTGDAVYREYVLSYKNDDHFSRLYSVTEKNGAGESLNPVYLNWDYLPDFSQTAKPTNVNNSPAGFGEQNFTAMDLNGDGLEDLIGLVYSIGSAIDKRTVTAIVYYASVNSSGEVSFTKSNNSPFVAGEININTKKKGKPYMAELMCSNLIKNGLFASDISGAGVNELVIPSWNVNNYLDKPAVLKFDVHNVTTSQQKSYSYTVQPTRTVYKGLSGNNYIANLISEPLCTMADFDNDGKTDIFILETGDADNNTMNNSTTHRCCLVKYNQATNQFQENRFDIKDIVAEQIFPADFNGDGMIDILVVGPSSCVTFWNQGDGTFSDSNKLIQYDIYGDALIRLGDFNGNGLPDLLVNPKGSTLWVLGMNDGSGRFISSRVNNVLPSHDQATTEDDNDLFTCLVYDFDFDGKSDVFMSKAIFTGKTFITNRTYWLRSTGTSLEVKESAEMGGITVSMPRFFALGDFNGDGRQEFMNYGLDCYNGGNNATAQWRMYQNPLLETSSGMLTHVKNTSNTDVIKYGNLTDASVYSKSNTSTYPVVNIQAALPVVKSITSINGLDNQVTVSYKYEGAKVHLQGKGLLGFSKQTSENNLTGAITETEVSRFNTTYFTPLVTATKTTLGGKTTQTTTAYTYINKGGKKYFAHPSTVTEKDFDGNTNTTTYRFDTNGNITQEKTTLGGSSNYRQTDYSEYTVAGGNVPNKAQKITVTQKHSDDTQMFTNTTAFTYNTASGSISSKTENYGTALAITTGYSYDNAGNLTYYQTSGSGISSKSYYIAYDYTKRFVTLTRTSPATTTMSYYYDTWGNPLFEDDITNTAAILTTSHTYDSWGRKTKTLMPDGRNITYSQGWGSDMNKRHFTLTQGTGQPWVKTWYDAAGRKTLTESIGTRNLSIQAAYTYNNKGELIQSKTTQGDLTQTTQYEYDVFGRTVKESSSTGQVVNYAYGNRSVNTSIDGRNYNKTFDAWGNVKTASDPGGTVAYIYNSNGKPKSISAPGAPATTMNYDAVGNQTELADPNAGKTTYEYNTLGQITKQTDARGNITQNYYDNLNRLSYSTINGTERTDYTYGTSGNSNLLLTKTQKGNYSIEYEHDKFGRVIKEKRNIDGENLIFEYTYDAVSGNLASETSPTGNIIKYTYDVYGNRTRVLNSDNETIWQLLNTTGTQTTTRLGGTINITKNYNASGLLSSQYAYAGNVNVQYMGYDFDNSTGNLLSRTGQFDVSEYFTYDNLHRLTSISYEQASTEAQDISYLPNGNIDTKTGLGQYYYENGKPHAVTGVDNTDGLLPETEQVITYNSFGKVSTITEGDYELEIIYGPDQQRWKTVLKNNNYPTKTTIFAPGYEHVTDLNGTKHFEYIYGGDGLAAIGVKEDTQETKIYYPHTDHLGSIVKITDKDGMEFFKAAYDAWGYQIVTKNLLDFHRGYTGHEHLPEFGLINMNGRMYDPLLGRMLSPDNYVQSPFNTQSYNRYAYVWNNPLRYTDPDGEWVHIVIGAVIGGVVNLAMNAKNINSFGQGLGYFGIGAAAGAVAALTGGAVSGALSIGGFAGGAITGAAAGAAGGFINGAGNTWVGGGSFGQGMLNGAIGAGIGTATGAILGGTVQGISSAVKGNNFWNGAPKVSPTAPSTQPTTDPKTPSPKVQEVLNTLDEVKANGNLNTPQLKQGQEFNLVIREDNMRLTFRVETHNGLDKIFDGVGRNELIRHGNVKLEHLIDGTWHELLIQGADTKNYHIYLNNTLQKYGY
jgi:RHS repeat-associated protein